MRYKFAGLVNADLSRFGIPDRPGFPEMVGKGTEATDFNPFTRCEAVRHDFDEGMDSKVHVAVAQLIKLF